MPMLSHLFISSDQSYEGAKKLSARLNDFRSGPSIYSKHHRNKKLPTFTYSSSYQIPRLSGSNSKSFKSQTSNRYKNPVQTNSFLSPTNQNVSKKRYTPLPVPRSSRVVSSALPPWLNHCSRRQGHWPGLQFVPSRLRWWCSQDRHSSVRHP